MIVLSPSQDKKHVIIKAGFKTKDKIKKIFGRQWNPGIKKWSVPIEYYPAILEKFPQARATEELKYFWEKTKNHMANMEKIKSLDNYDIEIQNLKTQLYPYQKVGVKFMDEVPLSEGAILAFDMGLGKTVTWLAQFIHAKQKGRVKKAIVVCPASLKYSAWEKEINKWTNLTYQVIDGQHSDLVEWADGTTTRLRGKELRQIQYQQDVDIMILNYELFIHDYEEIKDLPIGPDVVVVLDEAHRVKNIKSVTTKNIIDCLKPAGYKFLLTGTPLENNIEELWALVNFIKPRYLGTLYQFKEHFCKFDGFDYSSELRPEKMDDLKTRISPLLLRRERFEVLKDLPELVEMDYWVDMTNAQTSLYRQISEGIVELFDGDIDYISILAKITRLQQVCDSPALLSDYIGKSQPEDSGKLNELPKILQDVDIQKNKVVIFSQYKNMTDIIMSRLDKHWNPLHLHGGVSSKKRGEIQNAMLHDPDTRILVMTTAGAEGLDLYSANYLICYDSTFNPQKMNQIIGRLHRHGQKNTVNVINIVTKDSYEERKQKILEQKKAIFNALIDNDLALFKKYISKEELKNLLWEESARHV